MLLSDWGFNLVRASALPVGGTASQVNAPPSPAVSTPAAFTLSPAFIATSSPTPSATSLPSLTPQPDTNAFVCPDGLPSRLHVGDTAIVSFDPPDPNRVRENPGRDQRVVGQIFPGESFVILDGPACSGGWVWWRVRADKDGLTGWTAEGSGTTYWLVPLATAAPTAATAPRFHSFLVCAQPCLVDGSNAARSFPGGITKLYARWSYANIPTGARYIRAWTVDGREWVRYDCAWPGPQAGADEISLSEPDGLRSGIWEVTISINEVVLLREQIVVAGSWTFWAPAGVFNTCYEKV